MQSSCYFQLQAAIDQLVDRDSETDGEFRVRTTSSSDPCTACFVLPEFAW